MRLRTFGGLWLEGGTGPSPGPRRLGLLALVAAAGPKGISRDRVIGLLWPETTEEQARHALSQSIYALGRTADQDLIVGAAQLKLDTALTSDIGEWRAALQAGDLEAAARLYTGKFLDGFYLTDAPEFERWAEVERAAVATEVARALERLVGRIELEDKRPEAVQYWQQLSEVDPLSARYAIGHMKALATLGDRSAALARGRQYRETVARELNAEPDAAFEALEESLRAAPSAPLRTPPSDPAPGVPSEPKPPATEPHRRRLVLSAIVLSGIAVIAFAVRSLGTDETGDLPFLAVGEIRTEGLGDSTVGGRILRDMLATSLGAIQGLQVVANSRLVELTPPGPDPSAGVISDAARRAGATELIEGELSTEPSNLLLTLRRVAVGRGIVRKGYLVRAADRAALVDSATAAIARDFGLLPPSVTVARSRTASPAAYALYEEGLRSYYGYDAPAAYRLMKSAFGRDSSFAMAAYYTWYLAKFFQDFEVANQILPHVEQLALRTIERERLLIQLSIALEGFQRSSVAAAIAETLTVKYPQDPDAQILLGQVRGHQGDWGGAVAAYERAVMLDSAAGAVSGPHCRLCQAIAFEVGAYRWWDSLDAAERTARRLIALRPEALGPQGSPWDNLVEVLLRQGRRREAEDAVVKSSLSLTSPQATHPLHRDLVRWGQFDRLDRELSEQITHTNATIRADAWWVLLLSYRDQGRLREADTLIRHWRVPNTSIKVPGGTVPAVDFALLGVEMGRPEVSIRAHRENLAIMASWTPAPHRARNLAWQMALAGTAYAAAGDTAVVRRLADSLEALGPASYMVGRDARLHYVLRGLLWQLEGRHAEAVDAFRRSFYSLTDGYTRTNLMMARSLLALRRPEEAIAVLRPAIRGGVDGGNTYVSRTELREALAQAFEMAGQADSARAHWREVESAWRRADPQFRERYLTAKAKSGM